MDKNKELNNRSAYFNLTAELPDPLELYQHLPFQISVVSNLLQLNRDAGIRDIVELEPRELRVILNIGSYMPIKSADIAYQSRLDSYTVTRAVKKLNDLGLLVKIEDNLEFMLATKALNKLQRNEVVAADQKEIIRWSNKSRG